MRVLLKEEEVAPLPMSVVRQAMVQLLHSQGQRGLHTLLLQGRVWLLSSAYSKRLQLSIPTPEPIFPSIQPNPFPELTVSPQQLSSFPCLIMGFPLAGHSKPTYFPCLPHPTAPNLLPPLPHTCSTVPFLALSKQKALPLSTFAQKKALHCCRFFSVTTRHIHLLSSLGLLVSVLLSLPRLLLRPGRESSH